MTVVKGSGLSKKFPGVQALAEVSFEIETGKVHCVVGENGAGKSTLVKVLTGVYAPEDGQLSSYTNGKDEDENYNSSVVAYVPQELDLFPHMSVAENIFIPFDQKGKTPTMFRRASWEAAAEKYINKLRMGVKPGDIVKNIPISEQQLLQVARALAQERAQALILDEPTTALTVNETERLFEVIRDLRQSGKAVVFISHKLSEVFEIGDAVTVMRNGKVVGNSSIADVSQEWIIGKMSGEIVDIHQEYSPSAAAGDVLLSVEGLSGPGFENVSFELHEGEILGLAGLVGAGRSEIAQTLIGFLKHSSGRAWFRGKPWRFEDTAHAVRHGVLYLTEERKQHGIFSNLSVQENVSILLSDLISKYGFVSGRKERSVAESVVRDYAVKTSSLQATIRNLSGGNQQKVIIGRSMMSKPSVLIVDEPTKGIDVKTKEEIYRLMKQLAEEERVGIIMISSEIDELERCANRVLAIYNGRVFRELKESNLTTDNILNAILGLEKEYIT